MKRITLFAIVSLCFVVASCRQAPPDPKAELVAAAKGADLKGYTFTSHEDDAQATASFTSTGVTTGITLKGDGTVALKYESIRDKQKNSITMQRTDMVRNGRTLTFVVTDLGTSQTVDRQSITIPDRTGGNGGGGVGNGGFPLCSDAIRDYLCRQKPLLQCEANRTCRIQRGGYECCETPGQNCIAVDTIVVPNNPRCSVRNVSLDRLLLR